jgi:hypothetical protein
MNPVLQVPGRKPGKYRVGQAVRLTHRFPGLIGEIIEDRGPIGFRGRRLYTVKLQVDPWNEYVSECPEDSIEAVDGQVKLAPCKNAPGSESRADAEMEARPLSAMFLVPGRKPGKYRVGQLVRILHGWRGLIGEVAEDCGPIGFKGRRLYDVKVQVDPWNEHISILPEESIEAVDGEASLAKSGRNSDR